MNYLDLFVLKMRAEVHKKDPVGYAYYVYDQARPELGVRRGAWGYAVKPFDPRSLARAQVDPTPQNMFYATHGVAQSYKKRMEIMSMSKTITAAAAIKLIESAGASWGLPLEVKEMLSDGLLISARIT